jgi:TIR domain
MTVRLFYSYSHKDEGHRDRLETHLSLLRRQRLLEEWHDRRIVPGQNWEEILDSNLETSDIIILLISPDFIASDYCYEKEMGCALKRHDKGEATVIPVIVRPTDWQSSPFGQLQALPSDVKPITKWTNRDEAWLDVVKGVRRAIENQRTKKQEYEACSIITSTIGGVMTRDVGAITSELEVATRSTNTGAIEVAVRYAGAKGWYTVEGSPIETEYSDSLSSSELSELHERVVKHLATPGPLWEGEEEPTSLLNFSP